MGLEEKRLKNILETEIIPEMAAQIGGCYDGEVNIDVDWDTFSQLSSMREIKHQILGRIAEAVEKLCCDDFAKEAMRESFKTVYVKNLENTDDRQLSFSDGKLTIQTNWDDHFSIFNDDDIRQTIEAGL